MTGTSELSPAEEAARKSYAKVVSCIESGQNFLLEAGAGAGKTYSLIAALNSIIRSRGSDLVRHGQRVACITYTNTARDQIEKRTSRHPAIHSDTTHGFSWSVLKDFQPFLRLMLPSLKKWPARIDEVGGIARRSVRYELGHPWISESAASLHHDDVIALMVKALGEQKFRNILAARYPVIFIDEYQDTDAEFVHALIEHFIEPGIGPLIGFFGDHWQKIYDDGCGAISAVNLRRIDKGANFRSANVIVECLNRMRPELPQAANDLSTVGDVRVLHTNSWIGERLKGQHWKGDLPPETAHAYLNKTMETLKKAGWDFSPETTKILMLTNNVLATEQGYPTLPKVFNYKDDFLKKEDPHISFFADVLEPACAAYEAKHFGEMFSILAPVTPMRRKARLDKEAWIKAMDLMISLRRDQDVRAVINHIRNGSLLRLPATVEERELALQQRKPETEDPEPRWLSQLRELHSVKYTEICALDRYIDGYTPFSTKHGVKGAEFENVLVVVGRGWGVYDFGQMLAFGGMPPEGKLVFYERNRNLFYVACSRPKKRLALLFTQLLGEPALDTLADWFGSTVIEDLG